MDSTKKPVTLKDIARETGLSATAVSKALNDRGSVSPETATRVKEAAKRLNYVPNTIAKSLRVNETKTLGVIVADSSLSFFASVVKGIEETASANGYNIILSNTDQQYEKEKNAIKVLINKRIDGLILAASMLISEDDVDYIRSFNVPFVYLIRRSESESVSYVVNDNVRGAELMIRYLIETGSRRIYFINLGPDSPSGKERLTGYKKALASQGISFDPDLVSNINHSVDDGIKEMSGLLERDPSVKCVFCGCDEIGIGVMEAILAKGLRIPQDIRVAAYDDIDFAAYLRVPLTTVRQPRLLIGSRGAEMLLEMIRSNDRCARHVIIEPELVIRQST